MFIPVLFLFSLSSGTEGIENICQSKASGNEAVKLQVYDTALNICCGGRILNKYNTKNEELGCCLNFTYELHNKICCKGRTFPKVVGILEQTCCGSTPYFQDEIGTLCCNEKYHKISGVADVGCCGKEVYDKRTHICCSDHDKKQTTITPYKNTTRCCRSQPYDGTTNDCFEKRIVVPKHEALCGTILYDTRIFKCCNKRKLHPMHNNTEMHECCGDEYINKAIHKCCHTDTSTPHPAPQTAGCCGNGHYKRDSQRCCRGKILNTTIEHQDCCGSNLFDRRFQSCCGIQVHNISQSGSLTTSLTQCCGSNVIDTSNQICCHNMMVLSKSDFRQDACCLNPITDGGVPYNSKSEICVNGRVGDRGGSYSNCGMKIYDPTSDLCCNNKVQRSARRDGKQCCHPGTAVYDANTEICCDGVVQSRKFKTACDSALSADLHYEICSICSWDKSDYMSAILDGQLQTCHRQALWFRVVKVEQWRSRRRGFQKTKLSLTVMGDIENPNNKTLIGQQVSMEIPCSCKKSFRRIQEIITVSDRRLTQNYRRLGDSDWLLPDSKRIRRKLKKQFGKCRIQKADMLKDVKEFIEFKIRKATAQ